MKHILAYIPRFIKTAFGLAIFAMGIYFSLQGNTGLAPWDTLATGVANQFPFMTYGMANISISILVLILVVILREPIGFGTLMNAFLIGIFTDIYGKIGFLPKQENLFTGLVFLIIGMFGMAIGQYFYMSGSMGCGPRDAFLVGLGKRLHKMPIGVVQTIILIVVLVIGFLLGGKIGLGTIVASFGIGTVMQVVFRFLHFEPRDLKHENIVDTLRNMKQ